MSETKTKPQDTGRKIYQLTPYERVELLKIVAFDSVQLNSIKHEKSGMCYFKTMSKGHEEHWVFSVGETNYPSQYPIMSYAKAKFDANKGYWVPESKERKPVGNFIAAAQWLMLMGVE